MTLSVGTHLGPLEITGKVGAGGMGEVYRGRDPKLERDVAIKVLPESFTSDANRVARFEQEAKTLAALNHPNIAHVYGLEQADGQSAIVMELVEGPTLADRIEQGPIPADEALGIAMQIVDALEAAHQRGIIHRDLKPANIKLKPDGLIKVLDFGIAKAAGPDLSDSGASPIMTTPATQIGVILGTAAYMSPEQARGKPVDQRTDVWAFGCVLYEMLTGQLAFGGEDVAVTLARVIANDTDLDSLPATLSPAVQRTIELCLRKDPRKRVADIRDVRLALAGEFDTVGSAGAATTGEAGAASARRGPGWPGLAAAALVTAVAAAAITFFYAGNEPAPPRGTRFTIEMPEGGTLGLDSQSQSLAISPDGRTIAFATGANNRYAWHLRRIDALAATPLRGTEQDFETPFFSPDGRWLGFDNGNLWRLSVLGGTPTQIALLRGRVRGARWGESDEIVYGTENSGLWIVPAGGGEQHLTEPEPGTDHRWPDWLPGNRAVVFALQRGETSQIAVAERATGNVRVLIPDGLSPTWLDSGHLVYGVGDGSLRAVRFDDRTLSIVGDPVAINEIAGDPIAIASATMGMHYALAADGTLLYGTRSAGNVANRTVLQQPGWLTSAGEFAPLGIDPCYCVQPAVSPDGTSIALTIFENFEADRRTRDIWVLSLRNDSLRRLTFEPGPVESAVWSPDSTRIAYRDEERGIVVRRADGTGEVETILADQTAVPGSWAPDNRLLFDGPGPGRRDIFAIAAQPGAEPVALLATGEQEAYPAVSPDGRWLAYETDTALFVRPYPDVSGGQWQITVVGNGLFRFAWSSDSTRLYFVRDTQLMVTDIEAEPAFSFSTPRPVADFDGYNQAGLPFGFVVEPETDRILVTTPVGETIATDSGEVVPSRLVVIQDFDDIVRRLLPAE